MSRAAIDGIVRPKGARDKVLRVLLFFILGLFVLYYLLPLFVMVATSLKSLEEIRGGSLLSLPRNPGCASCWWKITRRPWMPSRFS